MSKTPRKEASATGAPEVDTLEHEAFLTRWSRRKAMSREGIELPEPVDEPADDSELPDDAVSRNEVDQPDPAEPGDAQGAEAPGEVPELPPIESLGEDSDYSAFMASDVPADLRRNALRKLFQSPKFNVRDGLNDYDLDYSSPEPLGEIVTAEMRHRLRVELERLAGLEEEEKPVEDGERAATPAPAQVAESEEQEPSADSEPDDDQPATA
jgi:hypothetical protein